VTGTLILAKTNLITTAYAELTNLTNTTVSVTTNAIEVGSDNGNTGGANFLFLGQSNAIFCDSIAVGKLKTTSSMLFNPLFSVTYLNTEMAAAIGPQGWDNWRDPAREKRLASLNITAPVLDLIPPPVSNGHANSPTQRRKSSR
jgi:hypothetical protein